MGSVTHNLFRFFRGGAAGNGPNQQPSAARVNRRSSGLNEFSKSIAGQEGLCILDLGCTSATNISRLTGMGHKVCTEDLLDAAHDPLLLGYRSRRKENGRRDAFPARQPDLPGAEFSMPCWPGMSPTTFRSRW